MIYECQACFTKFRKKDQTILERFYGRCPSCWCKDLKVIKAPEKEEVETVDSIMPYPEHYSPGQPAPFCKPFE